LYLKKVMTSTGTKPTKSQGATCLGSGNIPSSLPQARDDKTEAFTVFNNYVARTLTHAAIEPDDCAEAILFLVGDRSRCTTGHVIPVNGPTKAFLR
jgi:NAD(P)-dependent dehydrogenase (short-subunit alcohol dehydrogenase family)